MRVLDLFSGIGGMSLGLERAGMTTVAFCEIEPFGRAVLTKNFPGVPIHEDVRELRAAAVGPVDIVTGGLPCQPFSSASRGRSRGVEDDRFLWAEMHRLVVGVHARWVVVEEVVQFDGVGLETVVSDLEASGYEVVTLEIPACAVGRDHWRRRLWICGHANRDSKPGVSVDAEVARLPRADNDPGGVGTADGLPGRLDRHRMRALGNACVPAIVEHIGRAIMSTEGER